MRFIIDISSSLSELSVKDVDQSKNNNMGKEIDELVKKIDNDVFKCTESFQEGKKKT